MDKIIYTVRACRWGDTETHSYIVGVYSKKSKAIKSAEIEEEYRGGNKYICEIIEWHIDHGKEGRFPEGKTAPKIIKKLPEINTIQQRLGPST